MYSKNQNPERKSSQAAANAMAETESDSTLGLALESHRQEAIAQGKLKELVASHATAQLRADPSSLALGLGKALPPPQSAVLPANGTPIQLMLEIQEDMPPELVKAIKLLNMVEKTLSPKSAKHIVGAARDALAVLKASTYGAESNGYQAKIDAFVKSIESKLPAEEVPVELKDKKIHNIWVQGDYSKEEEFLAALETREKAKSGQWLNLIWVYEKSKETDAEAFKSVGGMIARPVKVGNTNMLEVDFKASLLAWKERPEWMDSFIQILDILREKKSFVAMSDIMRMIILYYQGGLYQDVKVQLNTPEAMFFEKPLVNVDKLQMATTPSGRMENWAMIAHAGCQMIEEILLATLQRFPELKALAKLPVNYANEGKYSGAHAELHERRGPWNIIEKYREKVDHIKEVNPDLEIENPRPLNSWQDNDGTHLDI